MYNNIFCLSMYCYVDISSDLFIQILDDENDDDGDNGDI